MFNTSELIAGMEKRAKDKGVPIRQVVRAAGLNVSTWTRWKSGETEPTFKKWQRLQSAAEGLLGTEAEKATAL